MISQNTAAINTALVIFSLVYFTCMKNSTTMEALQVAMNSATIVLNAPRSTVAIQAVNTVPTMRMAQISQLKALDEICSEVSVCSAMVLPQAPGRRSIRYKSGKI